MAAGRKRKVRQGLHVDKTPKGDSVKNGSEAFSMSSC